MYVATLYDGKMAERLKAADCKSADFGLRRFESYSFHVGHAGVVELADTLELESSE